MKIGLINEGTYPVATGGVSTWCEQLISGMPEHQWSIITITANHKKIDTSLLPDQVTEATIIPMWGPIARQGIARRSAVRSRKAQVDDMMRELWHSILVESDPDTQLHRLAEALRVLAIPTNTKLSDILLETGSGAAVLAAWSKRRKTHDDDPIGNLTVSDATIAASLIDRMLAILDVSFPSVDLVHASSNGAAALLGIVRSWRDGVPFLLTEHGVFIRERYLALMAAGYSRQVRYVVMAALRAFSRLVYREATLLLPVSDFNASWEVALGAQRDKITTIHNGVDPEVLKPIMVEPELPTISFVGRIDPLKDLDNLIRAYALVREAIPECRLRLFGPTPVGNEGYKASLVALGAELAVSDGIFWEGPSAGPVPAFEAGHVVALSSISEGLPFSTIEAMMCAKATVNTLVGGVAEVVGPDQISGCLVPAKDPEAFAAKCIHLLHDEVDRFEMSQRARTRAIDLFTLERCITSYQLAYSAADTIVRLHNEEVEGAAAHQVAEAGSGDKGRSAATNWALQ